jgi:hypothetical protein
MRGNEKDEPANGNGSARLARAERSLEFLQADVAGLKSDIAHVGTQIADMHAAIIEMSRVSSLRGQTNWAVVIGAAAVFLSFVVFYNSLVLDPVIDRLALHRKELTKIGARTLKREREIGREEALAKDLKSEHDRLVELLTRRGFLSDVVPLNTK